LRERTAFTWIELLVVVAISAILHSDELAETSKEIRAYEKIIARMAKIPGLTVKTDSKRTFGQAFHVPTQPGIVIVLHNANAGTWPEDSRHFFKETDNIRINDQGDMVGYTPHRDAAAVKFTIPEAMTKAAGKVEGVFGLATGEEIKADDGAFVAPVKPGSGRLVFLGARQQAAQWQALRRRPGNWPLLALWTCGRRMLCCTRNDGMVCGACRGRARRATTETCGSFAAALAPV